MNEERTGEIIRRLRTEKGLSQLELAEKLNVTDKAVSKWETGRGFPDVGMLEPLSNVLDVTVEELIAGKVVENRNKSANMLRSHVHVCPDCLNVVMATGDAAVACCGKALPPLSHREPTEEDYPMVEVVEDEYHLSFPHPMEKENYIPFVLALKDDGSTMTRLYPEGPAEAYVPMRRTRLILWYSVSKGLFGIKVKDLKSRLNG